MKRPLYHELHARSAFSFLRGASQPETLVSHAAALGYPSIAITDHAGFYGSARAHYAAKECGIRALVGATLETPEGDLPVLCASRTGYQTLSRHLTDRKLLGVGDDRSFAGMGLIALTGDRDGPVCRPLLRNDKDGAMNAAKTLIARFGRDSVYVELNRHALRDDGRLNRYLIDLARHLRLPLLASNAPLFATRADRLLGDAFACLRHRTPLDQAGAWLAPNGERHLKSPAEMTALFADLPEALINTQRLAERLDFTLENLGYHFPDFTDEYGNPLSLTEQSTLLRRLTYAGAASRYGVCRGKVKHQLEHELAMIHRLGFPGYFLVVHDLVRFAKGRGMLCQGRGSAANSAVCYALGITNVDPVGGGLLFERFLSDNRTTWPDIDIDFPSGDRREEVIQYVFRKYGARGAAMTANVITYKPRSAFREMSKVLGFPPSLADRFSTEGSSWRPGGSPAPANDSREKEFEDRIAPLLPPSHPRLPALTKLFHAVLGMPRHLSQHSGGMIVCNSGLDAVVPLQPATMPGRTVVQWDKDDCEDLGIVKIDLLGLGMLAAMEEALEISAKRGRPIDLATLPKDDEKVFDLLCRADTIGTFQVESRAQMATLPILRPRTFYDLVIEVAIIRPGPIVGDLVHPYLNRRAGREPVDCLHPSCEDILMRTLGVPLFQEQVLRVAMEVAGFTGAEADELRRAMAFKRSDERMERVSAKLYKGMAARGIAPDVQRKVVDSIGSFALYGFPESHAVSFALLAYASCWLKVHHPAEFYTGLINQQPMGFYSINTLIQDAKRRGLRFKPVSCIASEIKTTVEDDRTLRLGLNRVKGLTDSTLQRLIRERETRPFSSLEDFLARVRPNDRERRTLAQAGALNDLPNIEHRREALWQSELPLHGDLLDPQRGETPSALPPMTMVQRLTADFVTQGASSGPHPMRLWREQDHPPVARAIDLHAMSHGRIVTIGGMVICRQRPGTAKGHCFISLEDETGIANLFVPKPTFDRLRLVIVTEPFLLALGRVQRTEGDQPTIYVENIQPLPGFEPKHADVSHDFH